MEQGKDRGEDEERRVTEQGGEWRRPKWPSSWEKQVALLKSLLDANFRTKYKVLIPQLPGKNTLLRHCMKTFNLKSSLQKARAELPKC